MTAINNFGIEFLIFWQIKERRAENLGNSKHRALVTPSKRGKRARREITSDERLPVEQHVSMNWAQRLKRVFNIDITTCEECGGAVKVIASIEDPVVIKQILAHLERKAESKEYNLLPESRAPPQKSLFG